MPANCCSTNTRSCCRDRTKIVAVVHVSNSLGTINDVKRIIELAHRVGAKVLIDGGAVGRPPSDRRAATSTAISTPSPATSSTARPASACSRARRTLLEPMPPYQGGGDMIESVTFAKTTYAELPNKFEAGTPDIAGVVGLAAAIEYVESIGFENFEPHEAELLASRDREAQARFPACASSAPPTNKAGVISFVIEDPPISSLDIGTKLDQQGIAVRTGHHCCQPVMDRLGVPATTRASFAMYNTTEEIDALVSGLRKIIGRRIGQAEESRSSPTGAIGLAFPDPAAPSPQAVANAID